MVYQYKYAAMKKLKGPDMAVAKSLEYVTEWKYKELNHISSSMLSFM